MSPHDYTPIVAVNAWLYLSANFLAIYIVVMLVIFIFYYGTRFPWRQYPAGWAQMALLLSIFAILLPTTLAIYCDPQTVSWWIYNENVAPWRPIVRFIGHAFTAAAITNLLYLLWLRKHHPERSPELGMPYLEPLTRTKKKEPSDG